MAQFFKAKPNRSKQISSKLSLNVNQLDHLGAGMAEYQGKWVFIPGALPQEQVTVQLIEQKKQYAKAKLVKINSKSPARITPACHHYHQCGGCDMQHLDINAQRTAKSQTLTNMLSRVCGTTLELAEPIFGNAWHYRRRARLATWYNKNTKLLTLGFRQQSSKQVISIDSCAVLAKNLSMLIKPLSERLNQLSLKSSIGHVELIEVDSGRFVVLRITKAVTDKDKTALIEFAQLHQLQILLQDNQGQCLDLNGKPCLPEYRLEDLTLTFKPGNFIQVNDTVNSAMVSQAIDWLTPKANERILDLFCGVGNFSLPLAKSSAQVIGVEGVPEMVEQANANATTAGFENLQFFHGDLSADLSAEPWMGKIDKLLLDPARAGAFESLQWLGRMKPKKVVYVSCNPASLSRDTKVLLEQGYRITKASLVDMFPQTHHIETMVLFEI